MCKVWAKSAYVTRVVTHVVCYSKLRPVIPPCVIPPSYSSIYSTLAYNCCIGYMSRLSLGPHTSWSTRTTFCSRRLRYWRSPKVGCDTPVDPRPGAVTRNGGRSFQNFSEMRGLVLKFTRLEFLFDSFCPVFFGQKNRSLGGIPYKGKIRTNQNFCFFWVLDRVNNFRSRQFSFKTRPHRFQTIINTILNDCQQAPEVFWSQIGRFSSNTGRITDCAKRTVSIALRRKYDSPGPR